MVGKKNPNSRFAILFLVWIYRSALSIGGVYSNRHCVSVWRCVGACSIPIVMLSDILWPNNNKYYLESPINIICNQLRFHIFSIVLPIFFGRFFREWKTTRMEPMPRRIRFSPRKLSLSFASHSIYCMWYSHSVFHTVFAFDTPAFSLPDILHLFSFEKVSHSLSLSGTLAALFFEYMLFLPFLLLPLLLF